ncbi:MAG: tetratricopeptide repeat protein [Cytophagales bacterium]|nr:tetratricopeptide repeat protein [Cytophagales bacterium]
MKPENNLLLTFSRLIVFIGFFLILFKSFSQNNHPLIKYYDGKLKLNDNEVDSLVDQIIEERHSDYLLALAFYQKGVLQSKKGKDIGAINNYDSALVHLHQADTTDNYLLSALWRNQGAILHNYKLYKEAVMLYEKALEPSYEYSTKRGISTNYNIGLAMIQYDPEKALRLFFKLQDQAKGDSKRQARIYNQLGLFQKHIKQYDKAVIYFKKGLKLGVSGRTKADLLQNISDVYYHLEDYLNQERFLLQTLQIPESNRFIALMDLGECYLLQGRHQEARTILLEAEEIYDEQPLKLDYIKMMKTLAMKNMLVAVEAEQQAQDQQKISGQKIFTLSILLAVAGVLLVYIYIKRHFIRRKLTTIINSLHWNG